MTLEIRHALPLDSNLISYLTAMTSSWARKKIVIQLSDNGLAYWNGFFIAIPDFRYSAYKFAMDHPLEQQFSFYSALTFHESMHAKFGSHKADKNKLLNHPIIPSNLKNLSLFLHNVIEDGRIERLGLIKREGTVIHHQLFRLNVLISESNWNNYNQLEFSNNFDEFFNHLINQLFDYTLLGKDFVENYINETEKHIIVKMVPILSKVFKSFDPNKSIEATIKLFEIFHELSNENDTELQNIHLPEYKNHCGSSDNNNHDRNERPIDFDPDTFDFDKIKDFLSNPFSNLMNKPDNDDYIDDLLDSDSDDEDEDITDQEYVDSSTSQKYKNRKKKKKSSYKSPNPSNGRKKIIKQFRIIPKSSSKKEEIAYKKFVKLSLNNSSFDPKTNDDGEYCEYLDTFGNDMAVDDINTEFKYIYKNLDEIVSEFCYPEFEETYDRLEKIAQKTANYFLQLAGINIKKKDGVGNQKIILSSQKSGKLQLNGYTLSQLLAGNKFIYNKELPGKINITLDIIVLVDLTGSMESQVYCDGRTGPRIKFVNEATIILSETFHILRNLYNLPISFSIIGYSAPNCSTPVLEIMKSFTETYEGKAHAKAIMSWYPDGENCDARAIYESVKLLEQSKSSSSNKVIFFLSDGGGEEKDFWVTSKIRQEYPKFKYTGPKDYTDAIRYAFMKGIITYVFNLEQFQNSIRSYDIIQAFRKYYGENISLVENLGDLIDIFTKCLLEIFKKR